MERFHKGLYFHHRPDLIAQYIGAMSIATSAATANRNARKLKIVLITLVPFRCWIPQPNETGCSEGEEQDRWEVENNPPNP